LAKIANKIAKKFAVKTAGVYCIDTEEKRIKALKWTSIGEVWGIGRQHRLRLEAIGVNTALDFIHLPDDWIRAHMSVLGLRLKKDLQGLPFIQLEEIVSCAEKLRQQQSSCSALYVFLRSDPHKKGATPYRNSCTVTLPYASNSSLELSKYALSAAKSMFRKGIDYKKAGVVVLGLAPAQTRQLTLFESHVGKHQALMQAIDKIHRRYGPHQMKLGNQDLQRTWKMRQEHLSKRYTTALNDIIKVK
jgi:DNA polymerase V